MMWKLLNYCLVTIIKQIEMTAQNMGKWTHSKNILSSIRYIVAE